MALTATATERVQHDVRQQLCIPRCVVFKSSFNRPNLRCARRARLAGPGRALAARAARFRPRLLLPTIPARRTAAWPGAAWAGTFAAASISSPGGWAFPGACTSLHSNSQRAARASPSPLFQRYFVRKKGKSAVQDIGELLTKK
jgi:hypothetical protein